MRPNNSQAGLRQIADEAGVSLATASLVLRGKDKSSEATRQRVRDVAERLRYRPNLLVQGMQTGRTATVGVVVPIVGYFALVSHGIYERLAESGYLPVFHYQTEDTKEDGRAKELSIIHRLLGQRVDGIIMCPADESVSDLYFSEVWERGIPLVAVDRLLGMTHADFVGTDDLAGGRLAAEHLLSLGHRRLAQVAGGFDLGPFNARRTAFSQTVREAGATCVDVELVEPNYADAVQRLLSLDPLPTGVFLASDNCAPDLYAEARVRGIEIPRDLSVVGFAGLPWSEFLVPPLTTLDQSPHLVGREAAEILLSRIESGIDNYEPKKVRIVPELIQRKSTDRPSR